MFYLYMIKNQESDLYVGITKDPQKRLHTHNTNSGAWFTKNKSGFTLVFLERYGSLAEARQREIQIKKWRREKKEFLIKKYQNGQETKLA